MTKLWTYRVGTFVSSHGLKHSLVQTKFERCTIKHLSLIWVACDQSVYLDWLLLSNTVASGLGLMKSKAKYFNFYIELFIKIIEAAVTCFFLNVTKCKIQSNIQQYHSRGDQKRALHFVPNPGLQCDETMPYYQATTPPNVLIQTSK